MLAAMPWQAGMDVTFVSYTPCWGTTGKRATRWADAPLHGWVAASKGWSALAGARVAAGAFLCLYAGELLSSAEAAARLAAYDRAAAERPGDPGHALLVRVAGIGVVFEYRFEQTCPALRKARRLRIGSASAAPARQVMREVLPSRTAALRTNIDATRVGNAARFFAHDCGGGALALVLARSPGCPLPRAALFARRDLEPGDELTFRYGPPSAGGPGRGARRCACRSPACLGFLPSEHV